MPAVRLDLFPQLLEFVIAHVLVAKQVDMRVPAGDKRRQSMHCIQCIIHCGTMASGQVVPGQAAAGAGREAAENDSLFQQLVR